MNIKSMAVGPMGANCYIVNCEETKEAAVIDPGGDAAKIISYLNNQGLQLKYIINTHGHIDHIAANEELKEKTGAELLIHTQDAAMLENPNLNLSAFMGVPVRQQPADRLLNEGDEIEIGNVKLKVIHTPGHTRGGICLLAGDVVFTGDTLFAGSIGRTDFPGGSFDEIIRSIKTKLMTLPDDTEVYPGHMGKSSIGQEKKYNPFLA